ncbi:hypothetical protein AgCh_005530 [Apium graveolens]
MGDRTVRISSGEDGARSYGGDEMTEIGQNGRSEGDEEDWGWESDFGGGQKLAGGSPNGGCRRWVGGGGARLMMLMKKEDDRN